MIAHHVSHRGYDRVQGAPDTRRSKRFAAGRRRWLDWFDWIRPEAWNTEHNLLHHYRLGEEADPDADAVLTRTWTLSEREIRNAIISPQPREPLVTWVSSLSEVPCSVPLARGGGAGLRLRLLLLRLGDKQREKHDRSRKR